MKTVVRYIMLCISFLLLGFIIGVEMTEYRYENATKEERVYHSIEYRGMVR